MWTLAKGILIPWLCGRAADYDAAANAIASLQATEITRLQYAWNGVERLLKVLSLTPVPEATGNFNAATMFTLASPCAPHHARPGVRTYFGSVSPTVPRGRSPHED